MQIFLTDLISLTLFRILFGNNGGSSRPSYNPPGTGITGTMMAPL